MTRLDQLAFRGAAERELIFWDNNGALLRPELVAVLDFDFAGVRPRVDDLALPLCHLAQAGVGLTELRELVKAYDSGRAAPLSRDERRALPFAMARMALFLQYLLLPGDGAYYAHARREFGGRAWSGLRLVARETPGRSVDDGLVPVIGRLVSRDEPRRPRAMSSEWACSSSCEHHGAGRAAVDSIASPSTHGHR